MNKNNIFEKLWDHNKVNKINIKSAIAFKKAIARDSINKYDFGFSLNSTKIKEILDKNDFQTKLQKLGYDLSMEGKGYGLVIFRYKGENIIENVKIQKIVKQFGIVKEALFNTEEKWTFEEKEYEVYGRFYLNENNKVIRESGVYISGSWFAKEEGIEYDTDVIPVLSFTNNPLAEPDLCDESYNMMKQVEQFFNRIPREFEKGKLIYAFNNIINSTNTGKDFERKVINNGSDTFDLNDPDGAIANSMSAINNGMQSLEMIEKLYSFYENKALDLSHLYRDHGKDSRKNEYDLLSYNQKAFENMMLKFKHRERQLQKFIDLLAKIVKTKSAKIKLIMSPFEENRIKSLKASTELKVAQAKQAKGIAEKNMMEAETMREAIKKGNAEAVVNNNAEPSEVAKQQVKGAQSE